VIPETVVVESVHRSSEHSLRKRAEATIRLIAGQGVDGDAHRGVTVQHRSRVARDPTQPNLRQVHLIAGEFHDELRALGFCVGAGEMGDNITTRGVDLLALPTGTRLHLGATAAIEITGLRNPCAQLDSIQPGLMQAVLGRDEEGAVVRRAGVMAIVVTGGEVAADDPVRVERPALPHRPLQPV